MNGTDDVCDRCFPAALQDRLGQAGVIAVLVIDDASQAVPLAETLVASGIKAVELTLRTPAALDAIREMRSAMPELVLGAGTVLSPEQVFAVADSGADFAVAPGLNPRVVAAARDIGLPFAPGICTPSELERAVAQDCRLLKFFPSESMGGISFLKSMAGPYLHLGLQFIPLGGVNPENAAGYLKESLVHSLGGSWIAPRNLIQAKDWPAIGRNAVSCVDLVTAVRGGAN